MLVFSIVNFISIIIVSILLYYMYNLYVNLSYKVQINQKNVEKIAAVVNKNNDIIEDEIKLLLR